MTEIAVCALAGLMTALCLLAYVAGWLLGLLAVPLALVAFVIIALAFETVAAYVVRKVRR